MKSFKQLLLGLAIFSTAAFLLSGCNGDDTIPPKIYFTQAQDTTVLLLTPFADPGVYVEDNKDANAEITVESDFEDVISLNLDGNLRRAGVYEITYTATDLAGNESEDVRTVNVINVADAIAGSYDVNAVYENISDTNFVSTVSSDARRAGMVRFTKSYYHTISGEKIYLKVEGWLYSDTHSLDITNPAVEADEDFGWMATPDNPDEPFFFEMEPEEALNLMDRYTYIQIPTQNFTDTAGLGIEYTIKGQTEPSGLPRSRVSFSGGQVSEISLKINVTHGGVVDRATETYIPR